MLTSFVAAFPTPFSAVHLYNPSSCLPMMFNTLDRVMLSWRRVQLIVGRGLPFPVQFSSTTSVSFTILSWMMWVILGGSKNNETKHLPLNANWLDGRKRGENDAKTLCVDAHLFWKRRKKFALSNEYGYAWTGTTISKGNMCFSLLPSN